MRDGKISFEVQGRNGYFGIDEYHGEECNRFVDSFRTKKQAVAIANELNYLAGRINELEGRK